MHSVTDLNPAPKLPRTKVRLFLTTVHIFVEINTCFLHKQAFYSSKTNIKQNDVHYGRFICKRDIFFH